MKPIALLLAAMLSQAGTTPPAPQHLEHVTHSFRFTAKGSVDQTAPLFGPEGERSWAGAQWNPQFIFPQPKDDIQGAVFTVKHNGDESTWVNTVFDTGAGHMQYVAFTPNIVATVIDIQLTALTDHTVQVDVTYSRTSLSPEANSRVLSLGGGDAASGPDWEASINAALKLRRGSPGVHP